MKDTKLIYIFEHNSTLDYKNGERVPLSHVVYKDILSALQLSLTTTTTPDCFSVNLTTRRIPLSLCQVSGKCSSLTTNLGASHFTVLGQCNQEPILSQLLRQGLALWFQLLQFMSVLLTLDVVSQISGLWWLPLSPFLTCTQYLVLRISKQFGVGMFALPT